MASTRVTEEKKIRVVDPSDCQNPVFLKWFTKLGASMWLFDGRFDDVDDIISERRTTSSQAFVDFVGFKNDVEFIEAWQQVLERQVQQGLTVSAENIPKDSRERIRGMVHSPFVVLLKNPLTWDTLNAGGFPVGPVWERVFINGSNYEFGNDGQETFNIIFQISLQPLKTLSQ